MIFDLTTFTWIHTALSLIAMVAGIVAVIGLLGSHTLPLWTALFLITAVATSVTGFGFPFDRFLPSHWFGVISLVLLALAILARYVFHFDGMWRVIYVITVIIALYLDVFVGVVQAFQKIPALKSLAPTQSEPPFAIAQIVVLVLFVVLTIFALIRFRRAATAVAA
jgi:hypothetical protein